MIEPRSHLKGARIAKHRSITIFVAVLVIASLLGGSSRYDAIQLVILQPIACLLAGFAWFTMGRATGIRVPLAVLGAMSLLLLFQLLPLPFQWWSGLAGRDALADLAKATGHTSARSMSLAPYRTLNALAGLPLLFAAVLATGALARQAYLYIGWGIVVTALANALLGLLQIISPGSLLYSYAITNVGSPVGLFANTNHAAVFGAIGMITLAMMRERNTDSKLLSILAPTGIALLVLINLLNGSRAGFLATGLALAAIVVMQVLRLTRSNGHSAKPLIWAGVAAFGSLGVLGFAASFSNRVPALTRLTVDDTLGDLRFALIPTLFEMSTTYWPWGAGIGAFEEAYYIHEKHALLSPQYINMAHNDFLQIIIEGGLGGLMIAVGVFALLFGFLLQMHRQGRLPPWAATGAFAGLAIIALASYADYPLRTPLFQTLAFMLFTAASMASSRAGKIDADRTPGRAIAQNETRSPELP